MSLKEATRLSLQSNLDIAISLTNEELYEQRLAQTYGAYDPVLVLELAASQNKSPNTNLASASLAGNFNKLDSALWNISFRQNLPTGGSVTSNYNTGRTDTNSAFALFSPQFQATTFVQVTQPLRRNYRIDLTRTQIRLANLNVKINDSQFKQKVTETISRIQAQYWDLIAAIRDYGIRRESVQLAEVQLENNTRKVGNGMLAPISITQARAEVSAREVDLIASEEVINRAENAMRNLISNDRTAQIWSQTIVPTDTPEFKEVKVMLDQAIDAALRQRPELDQLGVQLEQHDLNYRLQQNNRKWQVDAVASFGTYGIAGPQTVDAAGNLRIAPEFVGSLGNAYQTLFAQGLYNWRAGFNVTIPLRNRTVDSQLAQLKIQRQQSLMTRKQIEQQILVEVRNAVQTLETDKQRVARSKLARELAEQQLDGENRRYQAGLTESYFVLERQRELSQQQGVELQALIAYKKAVIDLQKAMFSLLEANDLEIAKTGSVGTASVK